MSNPPLHITEEQIAAAQLRIVLDEKLGRQTPNVVQQIAAMTGVGSFEDTLTSTPASLLKTRVPVPEPTPNAAPRKPDHEEPASTEPQRQRGSEGAAQLPDVESAEQPPDEPNLRGRAFSALLAGLNAGQHLAVDAVVAFVDGELGATARDRAAVHLAVCQSCAAEVAAQRLVRSVIRSAEVPKLPAELLVALRDITEYDDLTTTPEELTEAERRAVREIRRWASRRER